MCDETPVLLFAIDNLLEVISLNLHVPVLP